MKKHILVLFFACLSLSSWGQGKKVMLVLGSDNKEILLDRVNIALRLYKSQPFDDIIVSGGCAAHGSVICEASLMFETLNKGGVPAAKIHKEENAKTTVQNYVFSRELKDELGKRIIQPGDTVYVVSNHWHAIPVAARLQKYDQVYAKFHIEGQVEPKATDKLDYVNIFNGETDSEKFISKGKWLTPNAVWFMPDSIRYFMDNKLYSSDKAHSTYNSSAVGQFFPFIPELANQEALRFIDAGDHGYFLIGSQLFQIDKEKKKLNKKLDLSSFIPNLPEQWKVHAKTGFIKDDQLFLFKDDGLLIAKKKGKTYSIIQETTANQYFKNWPFSWGKGNVSAAAIDPNTKQTILYRNQEQLLLNQELTEVSEVKPLKLKW